MDNRRLPIPPAKVPVDRRTVEYYPEPEPEPRAVNYHHHSDTGKEVVYETSKEVYADPRCGGLEVNPFQSSLSIDGSMEKQVASSEGGTPGMSRRRKLVFLAMGGILIVSIAIVIAAVLATTLRKKGGGAPGAGAGDAKEAEAPVLGPIPSNASLTATAWVVDPPSGAFAVRIIYQDAGGLLQAQTFNTVTGKWSKLPDFTRAAAGSALAFTHFNMSIYDYHTAAQGELFYLDDYSKSGIREWNWALVDLSLAGGAGDINTQNFQAHPMSKLGAYWPFVMFQDSTGYLREIVYDYYAHWAVVPKETKKWTTPVLEGGAISIVPSGQNLSFTNIMYQQEDRTIAMYERKDGIVGVYSRDDEYPSQALPAKTALASFAMLADQDPATSPFKLYTLYQDEDAKIQMVWRNDKASGWKGPQTFSAFDGADNGTSISCLTMSTYLAVPMEKWSVPRCFFVAGGNIRQVKLAGADWEIVGNVGQAEP
ncbi:hypothetical protein K505DRAFT_134130 [Melanomma pulvis-pyrius CBS 109.77]|uniref:Fucose-specific lectin n=1 Tax=Melanomma pulvis-pyrius CBS 109.77 TaxID=1314802 RepID=A0A6A6WTB1_9PLEO|nr:hypothetical protein K505DRAFT_134130 [Melanomma pulvis-pyrius CBS 109.77]